MRPLELKLRNFKSYFGDEATFNFRDRRLVGIVGPIGSGKSSILDAIAFALYGKTPTVAANTKSLIHQRAAEATVSLRFEVEGQTWEAVRLLRRRGASQHALYRYESDDDEDAVEKFLLEAEVNAKVVELLGLEFDAFRRSVLLAQGRFDEFLRSRPAERDKVLKGVFGHDRIDAMREAARGRAGSAALEAEKLAVRAEQLDRLGADLMELGSQLKDAEAGNQALSEAEPKVAALDETLTGAAQRIADADARLAELVQHEARFPKEDSVERVVADAVSAGGRRENKADALEAARSALAAADAALAAEREAGEPELLESAAALVAQLTPLAAAARDAGRRYDRLVTRVAAHKEIVAKTAADVDAASKAAQTAGSAAETAAEAEAAADTALHDARHADMAAALRAGLAVGEACPVCAQHVADLPGAGPAPTLEAALATHTDARAAHEKAAAAASNANEVAAVAVEASTSAALALADLERELGTSSQDHESARSSVSATEADLAALLGPGDAAELLSTRRKALVDLAAAAASGREALDRARADHDQAIRDEQESGRALSALRVDIADLAARVGVVLDDFDASPTDVAGSVQRLRADWGDATTATQQAGRDAAVERETATSERRKLLESLDVDGDFPAAMAAVRALRDLLIADIERREAELEAGAGITEKRDSVAGVQAVFDRIASDLTDARFVRYLLDEERSRLAALGSEHFLRLSSGRYLFDDAGNFDVVDQTSAGAVRKAESLSGGETFLASLALALALAEMVARTGGRLDSFFLDEGFGSLDPEHLDLAMDGIEALVAGVGDRLVVVVSHVPELRDRVGDLIALDRDPATGDTLIRSA